MPPCKLQRSILQGCPVEREPCLQRLQQMGRQNLMHNAALPRGKMLELLKDKGFMPFSIPGTVRGDDVREGELPLAPSPRIMRRV